jgi:hypothetical protein
LTVIRSFLATALVAALAGPFIPAAIATPSAADPMAPGPQAVTRVEYDAGSTLVTGELGQQYPEDLRGRLYVPDGVGAHAVVLLLHGRHNTCRYIALESLGSPCPETPVTTSVRSYQGYDDLGDSLASHGYLVASVNANGINTYDSTSAIEGAGAQERAQLLAKTLDLLSAWNAGAGPGEVGTRLVGRVDLSRIGLMGHSRGGEGVTEFIAYNRVRTDGPRYPGLRAVLALAATDFRNQVPTGVHIGVLLPLCDGDVSDLQGAQSYDRARFTEPATAFARHQWAVEGANHNFFNSIWTGDDNSDTTGACADAAPTRLQPQGQRRVGLALMGSFLRRYVGGETAFDDLLTGAAPLEGAACPDGIGPCEDIVRTTSLAPAADRRMLLEPGAAQLPLTTGAAAVSSCVGGGTPACPTQPNRSFVRQLTLTWDGPGTVALALPAPTDISSYDAVTFRTAVNHTDSKNTGVTAQDLDVVVVDADGVRASVRAGGHGPSLRSAAASTVRHVILGGVWLPLTEFTGIDLTRVVRLELQVGQRRPKGSIQLAEIALQR